MFLRDEQVARFGFKVGELIDSRLSGVTALWQLILGLSVLNLDQTLLWLWITASLPTVLWFYSNHDNNQAAAGQSTGKTDDAHTPKITTSFCLYHVATRLIPLVFTCNGAKKSKGTICRSLYLHNELTTPRCEEWSEQVSKNEHKACKVQTIFLSILKTPPWWRLQRWNWKMILDRGHKL